MTFSYLSSGPGSSDRSWIRSRIGDTSSADPLLQDEEIDMLLDDYGSKYAAGAAAAASVSATFARQVTKQVGKLKITMAEASGHYSGIARRLDREADMNAGGGYAGGISVSDKALDEADTDWGGASFSRGQFDNTDSGSGSNDRNG